jgi:hypothetical protein
MGTDTELLSTSHQTEREEADYHGAIDLWLEKHGHRTVFCFVQFGGVKPDQMPRLYLATPAEVPLWPIFTPALIVFLPLLMKTD